MPSGRVSIQPGSRSDDLAKCRGQTENLGSDPDRGRGARGARGVIERRGRGEGRETWPFDRHPSRVGRRSRVEEQLTLPGDQADHAVAMIRIVIVVMRFIVLPGIRGRPSSVGQRMEARPTGREQAVGRKHNCDERVSK